MTIKEIAIKNLLRRKAKAGFILAGIVIGVATVVGVITLTNTMTADVNHKLEKFGANILIVPRTDNLTLSYGGMAIGGVAFDMQPIYYSELAKISTIENSANLAAVGPILLGAVTIQSRSVLLAGIDFDTTWALKPWWNVAGRPPQQNENGLVLGAEVSRILGLTQGQTLSVMGHDMTVTGVLGPTGSQDDQLIFTPLVTAQRVLDKPGQVSMVEVAALCKDCPIDAMVAQITDVMPTAKVMAIQQVVKSRMETLEQFKRFSYGLSLVVVLIGSLVVLVTLMGSVRERTEEIGIFRAIGFRQMHIMRLIFLETAIVSSLAGIIGYAIGMGSIWLGMYLFQRSAMASLAWNGYLALGAVMMALVIGLVSGIYPATMAARMDPNQALKTL